MTPTVTFLGCAAVWSLSWMVSRDAIFSPIRRWVGVRRAKSTTGSGVWVAWSWVNDLIECPLCCAQWVAVPVALLVGGPWRVVVLSAIGFAGAARVVNLILLKVVDG